jgi:hypothetical protein
MVEEVRITQLCDNTNTGCTCLRHCLMLMDPVCGRVELAGLLGTLRLGTFECEGLCSL